jgi:hypothetical protein
MVGLFVSLFLGLFVSLFVVIFVSLFLGLFVSLFVSLGLSAYLYYIIWEVTICVKKRLAPFSLPLEYKGGVRCVNTTAP